MTKTTKRAIFQPQLLAAAVAMGISAQACAVFFQPKVFFEHRPRLKYIQRLEAGSSRNTRKFYNLQPPTSLASVAPLGDVRLEPVITFEDILLMIRA